MTYALTSALSVDAFIAQYGDDPRYELADGELIDMEPTGPTRQSAVSSPSKLGWTSRRLGFLGAFRAPVSSALLEK